MARPTWLKRARQIPIIFESDDVEAFKANLPKGVSLSEAIRDLVKSANDGKNSEAPAIPIMARLPITETNNNRQTSILTFINKTALELSTEVHNLELSELKKMSKSALLVHQVAKTRLKSLGRS